MSGAVAAGRLRVRPATRARRAGALAGGALAAAAVGGTAFAAGGYFATSWSPTAIGLAWAASLGLLLRERIRLSRIERLALAALTAYTVWVGASALWSPSVEASLLELQRALVYLAGLAAILLLTRRRGYRPLLVGIWAAAALVGSYSLLLRLFPGPEGLWTVAGYRQSDPLGYWNGLAAFCALGIVLALGLAAHGRALWVRVAAGASLVPLALTLYFTFSRGGAIGLAIGALVALLLDPRRLRLALAIAVTGPWVAVAVLLASRESGLTQIDAVAGAQAAGRQLAPTVLLLAVGAAGSALALALLERWIPFGARAERRFAGGAALAALFAIGLVLVRFGGPAEIVRDTWRSFNAPPVRIDSDLNQRLFTFSGGWRVELWEVALRELRAAPLRGGGAGTYERAWLEQRPIPSKVRNAHNLYVETLGETGIVGLALLALALAAPLVAAVAGRHRSLVPAAAGAYVLYLVHAGVDWDWELPTVTLAALGCGAGMLVAVRTADAPTLGSAARRGGIALAAGIAAVSFVGFLGNRAIEEAGDAIVAERWADAEAAADRALTWAPWSAQAWRRKGQAQVGLERYALGERYLRRAIAKDSGDWELWYDLALATSGRAQRRALARAERLNALSPEIAEFKQFVLGEPPA